MGVIGEGRAAALGRQPGGHDLIDRSRESPHHGRMHISLHTSLILVLAAALGPSVKAETPPPVVSKLVATTYGASQLHLVSSDGRIIPYALPKGTQWGNESGAGSDAPRCSPDGTQVAFVKQGSVQIRPLAGGESTTVLSGYRKETLLLTAWSPQAQLLIYYLGPPQGEAPAPSKVTEAKHFIYDLNAKTTREIVLGGTVCGWLSKAELLIHDEEHGTLCSLAAAPGAQPKVLLKEAQDLGQVALSSDGQWIVATRSKSGATSTSQIVRIELATGATNPLSAVGAWADYQWPSWSPSGKQTAWLARVGSDLAAPKSVVVVAGKPLTQPKDLAYAEWLSESTLLVQETEALVVLDAATGKELGRKALGKK